MSKHHHAGWDHFISDPGTKDSEKCLVCDAEMDITRNVDGPTSSIGAMFGIKRLHDSFSCPNSGEKWHDQALKLRQLIRQTPSMVIEKLVQQELDQILNSKIPTKTGWSDF